MSISRKKMSLCEIFSTEIMLISFTFDNKCEEWFWFEFTSTCAKNSWKFDSYELISVLFREKTLFQIDLNFWGIYEKINEEEYLLYTFFEVIGKILWYKVRRIYLKLLFSVAVLVISFKQ